MASVKILLSSVVFHVFMQGHTHAHVDKCCCLNTVNTVTLSQNKIVVLSVISSGDFGSTDPTIFGASIPITAVVSTCTVHVYMLRVMINTCTYVHALE